MIILPRSIVGRTIVYRHSILAGIILVLLGCRPPPQPLPPSRGGPLEGMTSRDGRLGSTCQNLEIIDSTHDKFFWNPVCRLPYVRLVANADDYHGATVGVTGYVLHTSSGLELVPSPEYLQRGQLGEAVSLRGGVPNDRLLDHLISRPLNDLCGPVEVFGKFDRTAMGRESHGLILGEITMTGYVRAPTQFAGQPAVETFSCKSAAAPASAEVEQRPKS